MPKKSEFKKGAKPDSVRQRKYNSKPEQKKRRADRNRARAQMMRKGKVRKGDGKDVDHPNHDTDSKKLKVMPRSKNRAKNQYDPRLRGRRANLRKI
jgi:hypothetical protein